MEQWFLGLPVIGQIIVFIAVLVFILVLIWLLNGSEY